MRTPRGALIVFSWLQLSWFSRGETVEQRPSNLSVRQERSSVINCSYSDSASEYFPWYKQELGKGPRLLIDIRSSMVKKEDQRLTVLLNRTARHLSLHIADTQPEDSAVDFCAASTHCSPDTCCLCSNLPAGQPLAFDTDLPGERLSFIGLQVEANVLDVKSIYKAIRMEMPQTGLQHFVG